jgi:hypothetical protein
MISPVQKMKIEVGSMRLVLGLLVIALLSGSTWAQDNPSQLEKTTTDGNSIEQIKAEVGKMLFAPLLKDRAWAAYNAGRLGLKEQAKALLVAAKNSLEDSEDHHKVVFRVALDSLIQLEVVLPAEDLLPLYKYSPDAVTILLAKTPKENREALLTIAREVNSTEQNREYWLALCSLLAEGKTSGFAGYLLSEMTIYATVSVSDESGGGGVGGSGSSIGCGGGWQMNVPEDFPPITFYTLYDSPKAGRVVLTTGTHTIYFERQVSDPKTAVYPPVRSHYGWNRNEYLADQLAALLNIRTDVFAFKNYLSRYYTWVNLADYQLQMAAFKANILQSYDELKNQLITAGLLTDKESETLTPNVVFKVYDYRNEKNKRIKLPEISGEVKSPKGN